MNLTQLNAISPIDGRYRNKIATLSNYFSEEALIKYRVRIEIEYFIALCEIPLAQLANFNSDLFDDLRKIYINFTADDAQKIKDIESITNHDVKRLNILSKKNSISLA
jgi:adenylosuccinate lyase